ncbi:MAG: tetratricopeptide repeat protein [Pseudomonadota bacterium]
MAYLRIFCVHAAFAAFLVLGSQAAAQNVEDGLSQLQESCAKEPDPELRIEACSGILPLLADKPALSKEEKRRLIAFAQLQIGMTYFLYDLHPSIPAYGIRHINRAVGVDPNYAEAHYARASVLYLQRKKFPRDPIQGALESVSTFIELEPDDVLGYKLRSSILRSLGNYTSAADDATRAIALAPDDPHAFELRGHALNRSGTYARAVRDFDAAKSHGSNSRMIHQARGFAHMKVGNLDQALNDLNIAITQSEYIGLRHFRGLVHQKRGDAENAIKDWTAVLKDNPKVFIEQWQIRLRGGGFWSGRIDGRNSADLRRAIKGCAHDPGCGDIWDDMEFGL